MMGPGGEQLSRAKVTKNQCTHPAGFCPPKIGPRDGEGPKESLYRQGEETQKEFVELWNRWLGRGFHAMLVQPTIRRCAGGLAAGRP